MNTTIMAANDAVQVRKYTLTLSFSFSFFRPAFSQAG